MDRAPKGVDEIISQKAPEGRGELRQPAAECVSSAGDGLLFSIRATDERLRPFRRKRSCPAALVPLPPVPQGGYLGLAGCNTPRAIA